MAEPGDWAADGTAALRLTVADRMAPEDHDALLAGIDSYNAMQGYPTDWRPLAVLAHDAEGALEGGLAGSTLFGWLFVQQLWVAPRRRRQGLGTRLLHAAEDAARQRGCVGSWLDTLDAQAPGFYRKLGYELLATLPDCPPGHARLIFHRRLDGAAP